MAAQVAIDIESAYPLYRAEWPVHREIHSLALATVVIDRQRASRIALLSGHKQMMAFVNGVVKDPSSSVEPNHRFILERR